MKPRLNLIVLLALSLLSCDCYADNGKLALARPVNEITVDGDFSDWPSSLPWHPIQIHFTGLEPRDADEFDAAFRVGYDDKALYVAIRVRDDSIIATGSHSRMDQDGCSLFLDVEHRAARSESNLHYVLGDLGSHSDTKPIEYHIYGDLSPRTEAGLAVVRSYQRDETHHRYEWRFDLERIHGPSVKVAPGLVLGLGIIVSDLDEQNRSHGSSEIGWGPGYYKEMSTARLGDILLVSEEKTGRLRGQLVDEGDLSQLHQRCTIRLHCASLSSPVTVRASGQGELSVALPAGEYRVLTPDSNTVGRAGVEPGTTTSLDIPVAHTIATPVEIASTRVVTAGPGNRLGRLHRFGMSDGLPAGQMYGVTQTSDGELWIASEQAGLVRFDQRTMTTFDAPSDMPSMNCKTVATDEHDMLWITVEQGEDLGRLLRFDGEAFTQYVPKGGTITHYNEIIHDGDGVRWIRDRFRISRCEGNRVTTLYEKEHEVHIQMTSLAVESDLRAWVGTTEGLLRLDAPDDQGSSQPWRATLLGADHGLPSEPSVAVHSLLIDSSKRLWFGMDGRLCRYDGSSFESWNDGLDGVSVVALAQTEDGRIWIGTDSGLFEFSDGNSRRIPGTGLVHDLYVDREQNVWIAGSGLARLDPQPMSTQRRPEMASLRVRRLLETRDGALWVGTASDLVRYKDDAAKHYSTDDGYVGGTVNGLFEDSRGDVWIATSEGVSHFDGQRWAAITSGDHPVVDSARAITEDSRGRIWIGTAAGVTIHDPDPRRPVDAQGEVDRDTAGADSVTLPGQISKLSTIDGLQSNEVNALLADSDGAVWVGTRLGVCRWRNNKLEPFAEPQGIVCLLEDGSNDIWAGGEGLYRFDAGQWQQVDLGGQVEVNGLAFDPAGRIWIATNAGLKVCDGEALHTLTEKEGALRWCMDVLWDDSENSLLVGGHQLLTYIPRDADPPVAVTSIVAEQEYQPDDEVRFTSSQPFVRFAFHGISFKTRPDQMLYRYRLRGFDDEWTLTRTPHATYGRLPPGQYAFEVAAIDRDLSYSETPASVQVTVDRDYRRAAFWLSLVCALLAVGFLSVMVIRRNRGIRRLNVELDERVKDRTAELETETAENKKLHEQLLQTQKLDAVGTMASGIAHDFNNSLTVIAGFAEIAKTSSTDSEEYIDHILTAAKQAAGTTKNLLTFSQESPGEKVPQDIVQLVRETADLLRRIMQSSIRLSDDSPETATIWCSIDPAHFQQVLVNVVMNARDALPDGGEISVSVEEHTIRPGFAQLVITDNGTGMPSEVRERIFDPFFTTKSRGQGTGLGMSIVHGIIEDHEGTIEIESSVGQGTTVSIVLPRCQPAEPKSEPPEQIVDGHGETILVVEDDPEVQAMIEAQLRSAGFDVLNAADGQQALDVLQEQQAKVQLALLDIDLPKMDGRTCLREIGVKFPHLPAVMMSGIASVDPAQLATPFLRKPFDRSKLLSTINVALNTSRAGSAHGVLVIDDDEFVRMSTKAVLESSNVEVYVAHSGTEAVSQLRENLDRIGTVLLDWNIPQADPVSILEELRRVSPSIRVLVVSGDLTLQPDQVQAKGFSRLIRKPVSNRELVDALA